VKKAKVYQMEQKSPEKESKKKFVEEIRDFFDNLPEEWILPKDPESPQVKIIEAARENFAYKGYKGANMRDVAAKAEVNQAMIHYYFGNKELLYKRVLISQLFEIFKMTIALDEPDIPSDRFITELSVRIMDQLRHRPTYPLLFIREVIDGGTTFKKIIKEMGPRGPIGFRRLILGHYDKGVKDGKLRDLDVNVIAMINVTLAYCLMFIDSFFSEMSGVTIQNDEDWKGIRETIVDVLRNGMIKK